MKYYVGIDIGGTNLKYGLLNENGAVLLNGEIRTAITGDEIMESTRQIVKAYQKEYTLTAVGVSAPGIVKEDGFMVTGGAIYDFYGINLKEKLETLIELPVVVENDANCAALAEKWLGRGKNYRHSLTVVVGTGIGGGIIINNQIFRGAHATAGEFGFMIVEPIEHNDVRMATLSLTGAVGCGVVNKYRQRARLAVDNQLNGKKIFDLADEGDTLAIDVIDKFYDRLAIGIFNMAVSFDPEIILIGGAISGNTYFMAEVIRRLRDLKNQHHDMGSVVLPEIAPCQFLNQAGIIGATYRAILLGKSEEHGD